MQVSLARGVEQGYKRAMCKLAMQRAVDEAVRRTGSLNRLAKRLGISRQALQQWEEVPVRRVLALEEISGVPRHEIRPDVYPPPSKRKSVQVAA
jgi:DNA-binding transcriptional regulator YdaS (Cro superfamily)